jgi:hypothetical protein
MNDQVTRKAIPSAASGAVRLRRVDGGRQHAIKVKLDDAEYDAIAARAADCKLSVQRFLVSCALARRSPAGAPQVAGVRTSLTAELTGLRRLTANLANNINQIARVLNSGGTPDGSIAATADAVRRATARIDSVLAGLATGPPARPMGHPIPDAASPSAGRGSTEPGTRIVPEAPS